MRLLGLIARRFAAINARGVAAVEFALVGSTFMVMLLACFEFGFMLFVRSVLDNAARDAARLVRKNRGIRIAVLYTTCYPLPTPISHRSRRRSGRPCSLAHRRPVLPGRYRRRHLCGDDGAVQRGGEVRLNFKIGRPIFCIESTGLPALFFFGGRVLG